MNKKLFIFIFLIMASPVLAKNIPAEEVVINDSAPASAQVKTINNASSEKRFFKSHKIDSAKDVDIVNPDNSSLGSKSIKEQKKQEKLAKKQEKKEQTQTKKSEKAAEKLQKKELKAAKKQAKNIDDEEEDITSPHLNQGENGVTLNDAAYHASINTNKIIEVDECVKIALEHHPAIRSAMGNADIYKSRIAQAWAHYFPTFSAGISYSKNDMQMANFAFPTQKYDMYYVPNVSGNMLLFDFGKTKAQADIAKRSFESAKFALETTINTVIYNVKQSYFNLLFAQQQVRVYEETVHDYELHLQQAEAYYNIGTKPKIDVLTAEYNLGKARLNLIQAQNTLKVAYVQLSNAMGMPEYSDYGVTDNLTAKMYGITSDEAVNTAFETSPELLAAKKRADASGLLVRASKRAFAPDISGFASYSRGGKKIDTDHGYQVGAQLNYQAVNLLLLKKQVDEAKATYKKDLSDYENTKQNIYFEVKQAYINLTNAQDSIKVAKLSMDRAKEQYDQASGRYKVGLGDAIELKDAETTFRNSQLDYYSTLLNYHVSAANLERLMGAPLKLSNTDLL